MPDETVAEKEHYQLLANAEAVLRATAGGLDANVLAKRIFDAADAFVSGAPQHDDMTLVVVRALR